MKPTPRYHPPKGEEWEPRTNMGYLSGQNPQEGTAGGDRALPPHGGSALWGHV